jgi:prophage regulatory protein
MRSEKKSTESTRYLATAVSSEIKMSVFLRRPVVEARTGLSRSSIYDLIATGEFPKPVPLGRRTVGWLESEIADWQKQRIAKRDRKQA